MPLLVTPLSILMKSNSSLKNLQRKLQGLWWPQQGRHRKIQDPLTLSKVGKTWHQILQPDLFLDPPKFLKLLLIKKRTGPAEPNSPSTWSKQLPLQPPPNGAVLCRPGRPPLRVKVLQGLRRRRPQEQVLGHYLRGLHGHDCQASVVAATIYNNLYRVYRDGAALCPIVATASLVWDRALGLPLETQFSVCEHF